MTREGEMVVEGFFLFFANGQCTEYAVLCCTNKIITCFIINKHKHRHRHGRERERERGHSLPERKALYWDCTRPPLKPAVQEIQEGVLSQLTDSCF